MSFLFFCQRNAKKSHDEAPKCQQVIRKVRNMLNKIKITQHKSSKAKHLPCKSSGAIGIPATAPQCAIISTSSISHGVILQHSRQPSPDQRSKLSAPITWELAGGRLWLRLCRAWRRRRRGRSQCSGLVGEQEMWDSVLRPRSVRSGSLGGRHSCRWMIALLILGGVFVTLLRRLREGGSHFTRISSIRSQSAGSHSRA